MPDHSISDMILEKIQRTLGNPDQQMVDALREAIECGNKAALWHIADQHIPDDIKSFGERYNMPTFVDEVWRSAFIAGWSAAFLTKAFREEVEEDD